SGMPPFPGFIDKFAMLTALLNPDGLGQSGPSRDGSRAVVALLTISGLSLLISTARAGVNLIRRRAEDEIPQVNSVKLSAVGFLLIVCVAMMVRGGPIMRYMDDTARSLSAPTVYIEGVFPAETAFDAERARR